MTAMTNHGHGDIQYSLFYMMWAGSGPLVKMPINEISDDKLEEIISSLRLENGDGAQDVSILQAEHYRRITGNSGLLNTVVSGIIRATGFVRFMFSNGNESTTSPTKVGNLMIEYQDTIMT